MTETLLADRLIEFSQTYRGPKILREEFVYLAHKIKAAQRFVVSPDVRGAIRSLLTSRPSTLVEASRFARLPFEQCWFEWKPPDEANIHAGQLPVRRCGGFLEQYGEHGFTLFTAWEFERDAMRAKMMEEVRRKFADDEYAGIDDHMVPNFGISSVVGAYDLADFDSPPGMDSDPKHKWFHQRPLTMEDLEKQRDDVKNGVKWVFKDPKEWRAIKQLEERSAFRVHVETHGYEKIIEQRAMTGDISSIIHDVQVEMGHLFATLILMNSKNCIDIAKTEPPVKLNKARSKRGKPELLPYSTVHIELSKSQQRAVEGGLISREEARRHLVRGHFKVRATGVFWWGGFMRGNAARGTVERSAHIVETNDGS
jgi:hypothetical protein